MKSDFSYVFDRDNIKILNQLSSNRTSKVFLGVDSSNEQLVAITVMSPTMLPGEKSMACFDSLVSQRHAVDHENITKLLYNGRCKLSGMQDSCYFVSEYLEGTTLSSKIKSLSEEPLHLREIIELLLQFVSALEHLHKHNISAYSLNPKEILLGEKSNLILPAFSYVSSSQWMKDGGNYTIVSGVDYRYIAPEMVKPGMLAAGDMLTDTYLLGLLAFEIACGEVPFDANRETLTQLHLHESPPTILSESGLPQWYEDLVHNCLEKKPEKRPTLESIAAELIKQKDSASQDELNLYPQYTKRNLHILFVEDNKLDQLSFARFAKSMRYPFTYAIARSVGKAKEMLAREIYDVVVSDFMLPDGTGVDVVKAAKPTPTIVVTGAGREDVAARALRAGAFDYISKDVMHKHLVELPNAVAKAYEFGKVIRERDKFVKRANELEKQSHTTLAKIALAEKFENIISTSSAYLQGLCSLAGENKELLEKLHELESFWNTNVETMQEVFTHPDVDESRISANEVNTAVDEVTSLLTASENLTNITFTVRSTIDLDFHLTLSKLKFKQIILHLVKNSCEALSSSKGQITINLAPKRSFVQEVISDPWLIVTIEDTGLGFEADIATSLFQPFVTTKQERGHLGIGLSIVNELVREAGGYIFAKNPSYGGARFEIFLPFAAEGQALQQCLDIPFAEVLNEKPKDVSIFLAESSEQSAEMIKNVFAAQGINLTLVNSLDESLAILAKKNTDATPILIVSENLPYLNRITSFASESKSRLPIIQLCRTVPNLPTDCFRKTKQKYFLQKPFNAENIIKVLNHCANKEG